MPQKLTEQKNQELNKINIPEKYATWKTDTREKTNVTRENYKFQRNLDTNKRILSVFVWKTCGHS